MKEVIFQTYLTACLEADDLDLPVSKDSNNRLLSQLNPGEFTFLTISVAPNMREDVMLSNISGTLILERGINGTTPLRFPRGSMVMFEVTTAVVKWLVCNHDCCADEPCEAVPPEETWSNFPDGKAGIPWVGTVVFSGSLPMQIGVSSLPSWITAEVGKTSVVFRGTPPASTSAVSVSCAATNMSGKVVPVTGQFSVAA